MPRIDLPQYEPLSASPPAPRASMNMFDAEFAAGRNLANAAAGAAATVADIRQKAVDADEQMQLQTNLAELDEWQKDFAQQHANDDPKTWEAEFQKQSADKIAELTPKNLSPRGRLSYKHQTDLWTIHAAGGIRHAATAKMVSNGIANGEALFNTRIAQLDPEGAADAVDLMRSHDLISEADAKARKSAIPSAVAQTRARMLMNSGNPAQAVEFLNSADSSAIDEKTRGTLLTAAKSATYRDNTETLQGISRFVTNGIKDSDPTFNALLDKALATVPGFTPELAAQMRNKALGVWEKTRPQADATGPSNYDLFVNKLYGYDSKNPEERANMWHNLMSLSQGMNPDQFSRARTFVEAADRADANAPTSRPAFTEALRQLHEAHTSGLLAGPWNNVHIPKRNADGSIAQTDELDAKGRPTGKKIDAYELDPADGSLLRGDDPWLRGISLKVYTGAYEALVDHVTKHPDATLRELQGVMSGYTSQAAVNAILDAAGGGGSRFTVYGLQFGAAAPAANGAAAPTVNRKPVSSASDSLPTVNPGGVPAAAPFPLSPSFGAGAQGGTIMGALPRR